MNTMKIASTGTVHYTRTEVLSYQGQTRTGTLCSGRLAYGYVQAPGTSQVTCPKCIAKNA